MAVMVERGCGLDVHQAKVVACLLKEIRTFAPHLQGLRDWLVVNGCTQVGMESTGVYWLPVYAVLEGSFELVVGNAQHIKTVPGRKTDVRDCEWSAMLLRHGLIRGSLVPPEPLRELRDLLRDRRRLANAEADEGNRLLKLLESANIKLSGVATDVFGVSGRAMLRVLIDGQTDPAAIANLARGKLRNKLEQLALALDGCVDDHHRFMLDLQLERIEAAERDLAKLDQQIAAKLAPYAELHHRLTTIPGVEWFTAAVIIAELGTDMSVFPSAAHVAAWAGLCPGSYESAGRAKGGKVRKGNVHLKTALVTAAVAVAPTILIAAYHMLRNRTEFTDLGPDHLARSRRWQSTKNLVRRLQQLGYQVALTPLQCPASSTAPKAA